MQKGDTYDVFVFARFTGGPPSKSAGEPSLEESSERGESASLDGRLAALVAWTLPLVLRDSLSGGGTTAAALLLRSLEAEGGSRIGRTLLS